MSRDDLQHIRDRLMQMSEDSSNQRIPFNVKRKGPLSRQTSKAGSGSKLSVQDFVRMDPGYTPDIEHLVFPNSRRRSPQQVAPVVPVSEPPPPPTRTRSRLAEMFALSRHLQRSNTERQDSKKIGHVNRSIDSAMDSKLSSQGRQSSMINDAGKRWVYSVDAGVRQNSFFKRINPLSSDKGSVDRGPNVSVLHLRKTEPWEKPPYNSAAARSRFTTSRSTTISSAPSSGPSLTKHQSLGSNTTGGTAHKWTNSPSFHSGSEVNSPGIFTFSGNYNRELSPMRWCDREVDGVYLGRSGWVQVQQRSFDDNRRASYSVNLAKSLQSQRTGVKLANYHFFSEPNKCAEYVSICRTPGSEVKPADKRRDSASTRPEKAPKIEKTKAESLNDARPLPQRPAVLSLQTRSFERTKYKTPSPLPEPGSPPSITPIISPPPAFQDKSNSPAKARSFFGKTPFLPRSKAIVDSDNSPPQSPIGATKWVTTAPNAPNLANLEPTKSKTVIKTSPGIEKPPRTSKKSVPQAKSLEETTASRRMQFKHQYGSSSSSSSSMGFRSLDSCLNRNSNVMPRLLESADSSVDACGDADEEDNNSSSANMNVMNPNLLQVELNRKLSPSGRSNRLTHHRNQLRRSPAGSDTKPSPASSSSSSNEFISGSSPTPQHPTVLRRPSPNRPLPPTPKTNDDTVSRVRRSRSLQLPEKTIPTFPVPQKLSPQNPDQHKVVLKVGGSMERPPHPLPNERSQYPSSVERSELLEDEMMREAEVVAGFLYGNRSRAAAQALLMHRYNNSNISMEEKNRDANKPAINNDLTVYYVGNNRNERQRVLLRGATSPSLQTKNSLDIKDPQQVACSPETCHYWPHCAHRRSLDRESHLMMRSSQSYPSHQRSLDSVTSGDSSRTASTVIEKKPLDAFRRRSDMENRTRKPQPEFRRISPSRPPATGSSLRRNGSTEMPVHDRKLSPRSCNNVSDSSSGSEVWLNTSRVSSVKGSRASTPVDAYSDKDKISFSRPGSAPMQEVTAYEQDISVAQQRSMSLPKSFLTGTTASTGTGVHLQSGPTYWNNRQPNDSRSSSPGLIRKLPSPEVAHTAPGTPLHEGTRGRSYIDSGKRPKATSTPHLSELSPEPRNRTDPKRRSDSLNPSLSEDAALNSISSALNHESVLQKFRKTISLHFNQRKSNKEECASDEDASENVQSDDESSPRPIRSKPRNRYSLEREESKELATQKSRFSPLVWRSNKERKKLNKAARSAKCNSGDSGIQIEIPGSYGGNGGESSESHDTDDSPIIRRKQTGARVSVRPHSDCSNHIATENAKADDKQHRHQTGTAQVRRSRSDLGGQRLLGWEQRQAARRLLRNMALSRRPLSPRKRPPDEIDEDNPVILRRHAHGAPPRRPALRRSLSQPVDLDKISPLMVKPPSSQHLSSQPFGQAERNKRVVSVASNTSDEDTMSDSDVSSIASLSGHKNLVDIPDDEVVILAEAVFDHVAIEPDELPFRAGDVIEVEDTRDREWWWGSNNHKYGWFPAQFVRLRVSQEDTVEDCLAAIASGRPVSTQIRRRTSISLLSNDQVRTSVVRELVQTERDFVKGLQDISEGYVSECKKRQDMFTPEQISRIFINLEDILKFQVEFLKDLEDCINWEAPHRSCIGDCFLKHSAGFKMYSDYCNSHPLATAALQDLYQYNNYTKFFEACRLMRGLIEIPLDGYLLTPVQRICKYPLQLAELLKYTRTDHEDYPKIKEALEVMRDVAMLINERKRRMESLEKLAAWQQRVDAWEGEDLIELSSQLLRQGDVVRVTTGMWTNNITLFLFDHQLIYCKKDILKRNTHVYKGRICLDTSELIDVPDGKESNLNVSVRHAIKILDGARDKWFIFCCRSVKEKQRWLEAFGEERRLVHQDKDDGLDLPPAARHLARVAAYRQKRPPRKLRYNKNPKDHGSYLGSSMLQLNTNSSNSHSLIGRKMATWFNFGAGKKSRQAVS